MKKICILVAITITFLITIKTCQEEQIIIPTDSIRFRIIAATNDDLDIKRKKELKEYIEEEIINLTKESTTTEEVDKIIVDNLEVLNNKIYNFLGNKDYKIDYGLNYFPSKTYNGIIYEPGLYKSLVITLGNGLGQNWWCTLFPPLCLLEENTTTANVEYKLFISSIIDKFK